MTSPRHFAYFIALGMFWGVSPSVYRYLAETHMPPAHTIVYTGLAVGIFMLGISILHNGWDGFDPKLRLYGALCAFLMNIPFAINLFLSRHVPPTELAIIVTLSPLFNYLIALVTRTENVSVNRLLAIVFGFSSTLVLILSREGMLEGRISWWLISAISVPMLYCAYNFYAARNWPRGAGVLQAGAAESLWSGILMLPFMFYFTPPGAADGPSLAPHLVLILLSLMWVLERIAYFTLINEKGAVYTVQATYVSTPASVIIGAVIFGGVTDMWLWISLGLLMIALWLNNTGRAAAITPAAATQPSS